MWQYLKMTWMFFWRFGLFNLIYSSASATAVLVIAAITAAILRFGFKKSIAIFPIIHVLTGRNPILHQDDRGFGGWRPPADKKTIQKQASQRGFETGYEPRHLKNMPTPGRTVFNTMYGHPGSGLSSAKHMTKYSISSGQLGERNFAKALSMTTPQGLILPAGQQGVLLHDIISFWSVAMPSERSISQEDPKYKTDIDNVLVVGNTILLIDLKLYKSGDVTYSTNQNMLYCVDNHTQNWVGEPKIMSANMHMAVERFKKHFPRMDVQALVVFMPTDAGAAQFQNAVWTGGIPIVGVQEALYHIGQLVQRGTVNQKIARKLIPLVKN